MQNREIRFTRVREQELIAQLIDSIVPDRSILGGISTDDLRLIRAGTIGRPFEHHVSNVLATCGLRPVVTRRVELRGCTAVPTALHGGVVIYKDGKTILELDALVLSTPTQSNRLVPMIVEVKSGKPHTAFNDDRLRTCIDIGSRIFRAIFPSSIKDCPVAFTVIKPSRKIKLGRQDWEKAIEQRGGRVVHTGSTISQFHKQLLSLLQNHTPI